VRVQCHAPTDLPPPTVLVAGWAPAPLRTGAENIAAAGIRPPGRPAGRDSLYRLSHPTHADK
jgi:hypothetical protein